jgi:putative chitinase
MITPEQIANSTGSTLMRAANWCQSLNDAMTWFDINSPARVAAFLAQIGVESDHLEYVREIWGPTAAQRGYEGRADLGNAQPGDGYRFLGRGLIQITGRANAKAVRDGLAQTLCDIPDFEAHPDLLEAPRWAALSAGWYWAKHGCNDLADGGHFEHITRRINGGLNAEDKRLALWSCAKEALGCNS